MNFIRFLYLLKDNLDNSQLTELKNNGIKSFLLNNAKQHNADIFITGDFKYHEFFDAEKQIVIADIGHFESEQFTIELIGELLSENFIKFAPCLTEINTNPVKYF